MKPHADPQQMHSRLRLLIERIVTMGAIAFVLFVPARAQALQPLEQFLQNASEQNFDNREARAIAIQRVRESEQAWARLLPSLTISGDYIHNQHPAEAVVGAGDNGGLRHVVISPLNQWDATFSAALTVIDVAAWENVAGSSASREAQKARVAAARLDVQKTVSRTYYQLIGASAVARASRRTFDAAEDNARFIQTRFGAGLASELDLKRALAEVERDKQAIADADYSVVTARRSLETLTGLTPEDDTVQDAPTLPLDDLHEEKPLREWLTVLDGLPSVRASVEDQHAADRTADAAVAGMLPTVTAQFTERFTNAAGFGQSPYYTVQTLATWKLDLSTFQGSRAQRAAADAASVRHDRARRTASDTLSDAWDQVRTNVEKSRAARASLDASRLALSVARDKYASGKATLLDAVQAERDAFSAEVTEIQAEADLATARANLQLSAGHSLVSP